MTFLGILIGTGILWLLKAIIIHPIAMYFTNKSHAHQVEVLSETEGSEVIKTGPSTGIYILVDLLVLGTAGFILGRTIGWFFIGITWEAKSWPGMLAFIGASIAGSMMHG